MAETRPTGTEAAGADATAHETADAYQSLYRRFRPQRFVEVLGQDHVTHALRNAVREGHVAHAYLFSGPRGTGKTSTARILAKALNCDAPVDGEPCDVCDSCRSITAGTSFDVHELDAASNNGVDPMRDLVARAALATPGRWKVYIVDEVHMLSTAASNALLKTLEEPPAHVVFVLATTDPQKVLPTIRSRTQHYEFHLLAPETLTALLDTVAERAALALPDGAVQVATRRARGSARDALSLLDQVAASGIAEDDGDLLAGVLEALADRDPARGLAAIDAAIRNGRDPQQLTIELVERLRSGFLANVTGVAPGEEGEVLEILRRLGTVACVRAMELLGGALVQMRDAPEPRVTLEVALVRAAHPDADDSSLAFLERLERLERRVEELAAGRPSESPAERRSEHPAASRPGATPSSTPDPPAPPPAAAATGAPSPGPSPDPSPAVPHAAPTSGPAGARLALGAFTRKSDPAPGTPEPDPVVTPAPSAPSAPSAPAASADPAAPAPTREALTAAWGDHVLSSLRTRPRAVFQAGRFVGVEGDVALFALPNQAHLEHAAPLVDEVAAALSAHLGTPIRVRLVTESAPGDPAAAPGGDEDESPEAPDEADVLAAEVRSESDDEPVEGPAPGTSWAESRLLEVFPGAELEDR